MLSIQVDDAFQGQESDLRRLKWLFDVPVVIFSGQKVTDGWIKATAEMPALEELHLYQARVSEASLPALTENQTLRQLGIYYSPVGDKVFDSLAKLPWLAFVKLYGTQVTTASVEKFKATAAPARLDCRRGAFLGVGCQGLGGNCTISTVHEGSPAEKGGVLREDVIIRFGPKEVAGFDVLTEEISRRDVGEDVEIELTRKSLNDQGEPTVHNIVTKVQLSPWELDLAVRNGPRP